MNRIDRIDRMGSGRMASIDVKLSGEMTDEHRKYT